MNGETLAAELGLHASGHQNGVRGSSGTLLFDEISELDDACQRILLYALPDGEPNPLPGRISARIISSTSKKLDEEMKAGRFRSELYYRINGVCLRLPPLRDRKEDIPMLAELFLTKHAALLGRPQPALSPRALGVFLDHAWPGNIRELESAVKNIVALGEEQLVLSGLSAAPSVVPRAAAMDTHTRSLKLAARTASRQAERELILEALARTRWNRKRAAQELQISYKSLLYKLKQIGFQDSETN
jgi:DNA-binding NtrC family response regulator